MAEENNEIKNEDIPVNIKPNSVSVLIDDDKNSNLHYAAAAGDETAVKEEIIKGQKIDAENYLGWTPLMMAARNKHGHIVQLLIVDYKADATKRNKFGHSIFLISCTSGKLEIVSFLLQHLLCGGISRQSLQKVFSPLSVAILFRHVEVVKYLIQQSFDINCATPMTGITPLMIAEAMELKEIQTILIESGADTTLKNILGYTAELQAKKRKPNHREVDNLCLPQIPVIVVSPPFIQYTDPVVQNCNSIRKASNTISPNGGPPNVSPISPVQYFFPPDFSSNHPFISANHVPSVSPMTPNAFMNMRLYQTMLFSSFPQQNSPTTPCA